MSTFLVNYHVGDIVDIKANAAQQKGMPHKYYHGCVFVILLFIYRILIHSISFRRTGIVYNVTPSAVGVIVYKIVGNRYIEKRVNIRIEHVRHSKCRQEFLDRVKANHDAHVAAKEKGGQFYSCFSQMSVRNSDPRFSERVTLRRKPVLPREAYTVTIADNPPQTMVPVPYETTI